MFRNLSLALMLAIGLSVGALAQTAEKPAKTETHQSETQKTGSSADTKPPNDVKKAPEKIKDIDSFFKDAEKQYEKDGQSCQPPPEPIA